MCMTCGCHEYENDHGDSKNIVLDEVERVGGPDAIDSTRMEEAAAAANIPVEKAELNLREDYAAATR